MKETTLVTGASSGIGLHLAHEFAKAGHPVVLVAPVEAELAAIASEFKAVHGVDAVVMAKDLENPNAAVELHDELATRGIQIDILVNNAGLGQAGDFVDGPLDRYLSMIRLNVEAVVRMTKAFLPAMKARGHGRILNTASIAGFFPGPKQAVYHGTKAFVLSFSESIATELEGSGVTVTALCPGVTETDFFEKADMEGAKGLQKGPVMSPQEVAKIGFDAVMTGERVVVAGFSNKMQVAMSRFLPEWLLSKLGQGMNEDVPPEEQKPMRGTKEGEPALTT